MRKLKLISKKEISDKISVYDIEVQDEHHYILKNGILSHNSIGAYVPTKEVSGGGGIKYNSSVIMMLTKSRLEDKESEEKNKKDGVDSTRVGIVITVTPIKQRFARPIKVQMHLPFYKKPNPYVGLEKFLSWETSGIVRGKVIYEKEYAKMNEADQRRCYTMKAIQTESLSETAYKKLTDEQKEGVKVNEFGEKFITSVVDAYAYPKDTSRSLVCKHLMGEVPLNELYTDKVFTQDVLKQLDETIIKPTFQLPSVESLEDLANLTEELEDDIDDYVLSNAEVNEDANSSNDE